MMKIRSWTFAPAPAYLQADLSDRSEPLTAGRKPTMPACLQAVFKHGTGNVAAKCRDVRLTLQKIDSIGNLRLYLCSLLLRGSAAA